MVYEPTNGFERETLQRLATLEEKAKEIVTHIQEIKSNLKLVNSHDKKLAVHSSYFKLIGATITIIGGSLVTLIMFLFTR